MQISASGLILISAFLHAAWNAIVKDGSNPQGRLVPVLIIASIVSPFAVFFISNNSFGTQGSIPWVIGSGLCEAGYMISLGYALRSGPLGISYTIMRGGAMIFVWLISVPLLDEPTTLYSIAGIILVLLGVGLTQFQGQRDFFSGSFKWALLGAFFICGYHLCYGQAMKFGISSAILFSASLFISVPTLLLLSSKAVLEDAKSEFKIFPVKIIFSGIICSLSFIVFLQGLKNAGAGHAITLRNTSVIFAQIFAIFIGEKVGPKQWLGSALVAIGALLQ